jgi:hypothetical protein
MRVIVYEYTDGSRYAYETTDDGSAVVRVWTGRLQPGKSLSAYVEAGHEGSEGGLATLLEAMEWLTAELKQRKENPVQV